SPAYVIRKISSDDGLPTILFDEADTVFGKKAGESNYEDLRSLLNAGYRRGATVGRSVRGEGGVVPEDLAAFCAVAIAGIGNFTDTVLSRSAIIHMERQAPNERVQPFRRREHAAEGKALHDRLEAWAAAAIDRVIVPDMPETITDRNADVWEPLL